jgi:single-strand DNA-binding protein
MGINTATLSGNTGKDPEIKYLDSGTVIASFSLAVAGYDGKAKAKKTLWFNCKAFNKTAELIGEYVKKGQAITVSGQLDIEEWESNTGKQSKVVLIVRDVQLPAKSSGPVSSADLVTDEDSIPF